MNIETLLDRVRQNDPDALRDLCDTAQGDLLSAGDRQTVTFAAARLGQSALLRTLFEEKHLYSTDPDERGRNVLHEAASSGDAETVRFAVDTLGFDPLAGDKYGLTPFDLSAQAKNRGAYLFLCERLGFTLDGCYRNPVLRGFHPDPSVVRVGEDYYMVCSSFVFAPGLPVFHSRDLVHWHLIGHAAEDPKACGFAGLPGGYGCWAPDISFDGQRFFVIATLRRDTPPYRLQLLTCAEDPRGPWSAPRFLPLDGIDPSLFTDEDGKKYVLLNPGAQIAELSPEGEVLSKPRLLSFGHARIKPEGPHLIRKDGWYYLFLAEGGTGEGHMETVCRSRSLFGPYEQCPYNPILSRRQPLSPIRRSGHGKPFATPDGRWYMVYLCGRGETGRTMLGRETALDLITWTQDGWPLVNRLHGPSCLAPMPFSGGPFCPVRNKEWIAPRTKPDSFATFEKDGIRLRALHDPTCPGPCSVLLRRQTENSYTQSAYLQVSQAENGSLFGLCGYYDERSFFIFGLQKTDSGFCVILRERIGEEENLRVLMDRVPPETELLIEGRGFEKSLTVCCAGHSRFTCRFSTPYLCDEGVPGGKRFTGALIGLAAAGEGEALFTHIKDEMYGRDDDGQGI